MSESSAYAKTYTLESLGLNATTLRVYVHLVYMLHLSFVYCICAHSLSYAVVLVI